MIVVAAVALIGLALIAMMVMIGARQTREDHEALRQWATAREASYVERDDAELDRLEGVLIRRARDVVRGRFLGREATLFEHTYNSSGGADETSTTYHWRVAVIELTDPGPDFSLTPRSWTGRIASGAGWDPSDISLGRRFDGLFAVRTNRPDAVRTLLAPLAADLPTDQHLHRGGPLLVAFRPGRVDGGRNDKWLRELRPVVDLVDGSAGATGPMHAPKRPET